MRDIDDSQAAGAEALEHHEEAVHFERRQRRRGLVENQHTRVDREGARDLHHLLLRDTQATDRRRGADAHAELVQERLHRAVHLAALQERAAALAAEPDVLGDRQLRHQREFLVDDAQPTQPDSEGLPDRKRLAVEQDAAAIGRHGATEHLDERRFAGAVFPDERVDFAGRELELDLVERTDTAVDLGQARGTEERSARRRRGHWPPSVRALTIETCTETTGGTGCPARCRAIISMAVRPIFFGSCTTSAFNGPPDRIAACASGDAS